MNRGLLFFGLQVGSALTFAPDNLIIAQALGSAAVTGYTVVAKLFSISLLLAEVTLTPLWPAYGEAMARGDSEWARRTLGHSLRVAAIGSLALAGVLTFTAAPILRIWVGNNVSASLPLVLGLGTWTVLAAIGTAAAMYMNAANLMWVQGVCILFMVPASIVLKLLFVQEWGVPGLPWAMATTYVLFAAIPQSILGYRFMVKSRARWLATP
jgi:O-antigen/teichoic acid export membrane protein